MEKQKAGTGQSGGIQSLDTALRLLMEMAARSGPVSLSDLARDCAMPPSKVHRYLASFHNAGLVVQAGRSGKYDLGPAAVSLGLSAIGRLEFVNRASDAIPDLRLETGLTVLLSVWGNSGATVIRWERAESPTVTSMGLGTTLPLLSSASGRAFLAWAPRAPLKATLETELRRLKRNASLIPDLDPSSRGIEELVDLTRRRGYACVEGMFIPGLVAFAAPILDWQGEAQAVVTLIGTDPAVLRSGSDEVGKLTAFCRAQSFAPLGDQSGPSET